jgi:hypothetical protein
MHKNATKCNETLSKWCKNKHVASKIIDTFEMYHLTLLMTTARETWVRLVAMAWARKHHMAMEMGATS